MSVSATVFGSHYSQTCKYYLLKMINGLNYFFYIPQQKEGMNESYFVICPGTRFGF